MNADASFRPFGLATPPNAALCVCVFVRVWRSSVPVPPKCLAAAFCFCMSGCGFSSVRARVCAAVEPGLVGRRRVIVPSQMFLSSPLFRFYQFYFPL